MQTGNSINFYCFASFSGNFSPILNLITIQRWRETTQIQGENA
jgi:hypothetical protein